MKFAGTDEQMAYSEDPKSICNYVLDGCNLAYIDNRKAWWETVAKHEIKRELAELRSNKQQQIRKAIASKYYIDKPALLR